MFVRLRRFPAIVGQAEGESSLFPSRARISRIVRILKLPESTLARQKNFP